jgi:hypothetical protein
MRSKPFTKKDKKLIRQVCDIVRHHLGIGEIGCEYDFHPKHRKSDNTTLAAAFVFNSGWYLLIEFYDAFFQGSLERQINTIVHEHLHVAMQPFDQILIRMEDMLLKRHRPLFEENVHVAREIVVDRLAAPIAKLLEPHLRKVL